MKYYFSILFLTLICGCVEQQKEEEWLRQIYGGDKLLAYIYEEGGKQGLLDSNKNVLLKAQFDYIEADQIDGFIRVDSGGKALNGSDYIDYEYNKYGIITTDGKVLFRPQFDDVIVRDRTVMVLKDSLWGYVDNKGNWIIQPAYKKATPFYKGTAIIEENGKFYLINKKRELVNPMPFDTIWDFKNDVAVVEKDNMNGFINYSGTLILPLNNYSGIGDFNWYHGIYRKGDKWFVIDTTGKTAIDYGFDKVSIDQEKGKIYAEGIVNGEVKKVELR